MALLSLSIKNLAVIESSQIDFDTGLTVMTGETGAGKSVILKALALMLGARADNGLIRHGQDSCDVFADFSIQDMPGVLSWLQDNDFDDDSNCSIRKVIKRDKGSKTYINGYPANLNQLKELGKQLIDLHGQHEHQQLLSKAYQLNIIDALASQHDQQHGAHLEQLKSTYKTIKSLQSQMELAKNNAQELTAKLDLLSFQVQEMEDLEIQEGEFSEISAEHARLSHAQELIDGYQELQFDLSDNEENNAESILGRSLEKIQMLNSFAPELKSTAELINSALANIQEANQDIRNAALGTDLDPERLNFLEQRIHDLVSLARKHRCEENDLASLFEKLSIELVNLKENSQSPENLASEIQALSKKFQKTSASVTQSRTRIAEKISQHVTEQMQLLGMEGGTFQVAMSSLEPEKLAASGLDNIEFLTSGNPGMPMQPLSKVASGGELSRISLAIQILAGSVRSAPTLIFDEVDVGVGGGTAEIVGNSLLSLSKSGQVLCITHLPQVAAKGDQHLNVNKDANEGANSTITNIEQLTQEQRIQEIARMLGGINITENTIAHAKEMLGL